MFHTTFIRLATWYPESQNLCYSVVYVANYCWWCHHTKKLQMGLTLKEPGGGRIHPLDIFCYISAGCYFFAPKLHDFFSFEPCAQFKTIFLKNRTYGYDAALRNRALGPTKNWPKTDFQWKLHTNRVFLFSGYTFTVLSYLFGLFGVRTCVSILWHTPLPKNATSLEKLAKNHDFGDFRVFDMTSLMTSLWRHTRYVCTFFWYHGLGRVIAIH